MRDTVNGTSGADFIVGDNGDDLINGFNGDDQLFGSGGSDVVYGQGGNDTLYGGAGDDFVHGGDGDDWVYGGDGDDYMTGGAGADTFAFNSGWDTDEVAFRDQDGDVLYVGLSNDTATLFDVQEIGDNGFGVELWFRQDDGTVNSIRVKDHDIDDVTSAWFRSDSNVDLSYLTDLSLIDGTNGADTLFGTNSDDAIHGKEGNDRIEGSGGNDILYGDGGNDTLKGGFGDDTYHLGDGADVIEIQDAGGTGTNEIVADWAVADSMDFASFTIDIHLFDFEVVGDDVLLTYGDIDGAAGGHPDARGTVLFEDTSAGDFAASQFNKVMLSAEADAFLV